MVLPGIKALELLLLLVVVVSMGAAGSVFSAAVGSKSLTELESSPMLKFSTRLLLLLLSELAVLDTWSAGDMPTRFLGCSSQLSRGLEKTAAVAAVAVSTAAVSGASTVMTADRATAAARAARATGCCF